MSENDVTTAAHDELDDLFNYDVDQDDVFRDYQPQMDLPILPAQTNKSKLADLGIDEEIQVTTKRKPIAKLDEERLLSQAGIPKLRRIAKERLKLKGKGHEFSDVERLLNLYQLWLDDLYPRAKFADGLAIIEKLGHSKRMQTMRREWINEGKPISTSEKLPLREPSHLESHREAQTSASATKITHSESQLPEEFLDTTNEGLIPSPETRRDGMKGINTATDDSLFVSDGNDDVQPSEDELDALLAEESEQQSYRKPGAPETIPVAADRSFDDEMDAMRDVEDDLEMGSRWDV